MKKGEAERDLTLKRRPGIVFSQKVSICQHTNTLTDKIAIREVVMVTSIAEEGCITVPDTAGASLLDPTSVSFLDCDRFIGQDMMFSRIKILFREYLLAMGTAKNSKTLHYHTLRHDLLDEEILTALGGEIKVVTDIATVLVLMDRQEDGRRGVLLTEASIIPWSARWNNLFYVRGASKVLRSVDVRWACGDWNMIVSSVNKTVRWGVGDRVFSGVS